MARTDRPPAPADVEPSPRAPPTSVERWQPKSLRELRVPPPERVSERTFGDVLDHRRSDRDLGALSRVHLFELLWHSARTRARDFGSTSEHRAAPASGGLHALELLVVEPPDEAIWRYDSVPSRLSELASVRSEELREACRDVREGAGRGAKQATLLIVAGDAARYDGAYLRSESLLWRDSGCFLMMIHLVSTWLGLGSCLLGVLGGEILATIPDGDTLRPAGVLIVGMTSQTEPPADDLSHDGRRA